MLGFVLIERKEGKGKEGRKRGEMMNFPSKDPFDSTYLILSYRIRTYQILFYLSEYKLNKTSYLILSDLIKS